MTFEEWLETNDGKKCMTDDRPNQPYLRNRLWWAYQAGSYSGLADARLQKTLEWYEGKLVERNEEIKRLKNQVKKLKSLSQNDNPQK